MTMTSIERLGDRTSWDGPVGDEGFTLIELMVVLLILAILLAIAIPTFLGVTGGANDRAAQSNLNTALTTAKTAATANGQTYGGATPVTQATLSSNEPSLTWVNGPTGTQGAVSWYVDAGGNGIVLASPSKNNSTCWYVVDNLQTLTATASPNGAYGATTTGGAGTATAAPSNPGTFFASGPQTTGQCDATAAISGVSPVPWKTTGF